MNRLRLLLFMIDQASAGAIDRAGAECFGGALRRARADAHEKLANAATRALLQRQSDDSERSGTSPLTAEG